MGEIEIRGGDELANNMGQAGSRTGEHRRGLFQVAIVRSGAQLIMFPYMNKITIIISSAPTVVFDGTRSICAFFLRNY